MVRSPLLLPLILCLPLSTTPGCWSGDTTSVAPSRYTSLTLAAEAGSGSEIEVWKRKGDRRVTLVQQAPQALAIRPLSGGKACTLLFGITSDRPRLPVTVTVRTGSTEVFHEELELESDRWTDREILLPSLDEVSLVFEADVSEPTPIGWGSPRVVCEGMGTVFPPSEDRPHIIVISIDTLRADHMGLYGYDRATTPHLDVFAEEATVFDLAFATSPWTLPSQASLLTGLYPDEHGAGHANVFAPLPSDVPTIAELLSDSGYRTIAHTGAGYVGRRYGMERGFQEWTERSFASLDSALWEVLDRLDDDPEAPFLLFLHTYSVHAPYRHPGTSPSLRDEEAPWPPKNDPKRRRWLALSGTELHRHASLGLFRDLDDLVAAYDSTIRFVDSQIGVLFDHLKRTGVYDEAIIIVTSDHGETFLERGPYVSHGYSFFDEEIRVPLLVRMPGGRQRGRSRRLVNLNDVAALILEGAGAPFPERISGTNPLSPEAVPTSRFVRGGSAFTGGQFARSQDWKVMTAVPDRGSKGMRKPSDLIPGFVVREQVFQLSEDASELSNLSDQPAHLPSEVWLLRQELERSPPGQTLPSESQKQLSARIRRQLRTLGYIDRQGE